MKTDMIQKTTVYQTPEQSKTADINHPHSAEKAEEKRTETEKAVPRDEYISSEKSPEKPNGLYHVIRDEGGKKKILFDDPKKAGKKPEKPEEAPEKPEKDPEMCTANTDRVDREIENLKKEKEQLTQQIRAEDGDEKKVEKLKKELARVETELSRKDNDSYRRSNTQFS